ncbi:dienelactone hydrolase family protein [Flavobacterium algicola]|uniref:dienelactone hydrolase family protein n=1 Tax=Flavobacterium algicola TaxID=556529 RepID=UPI001EFE49F5|nr:dienelactone hydrolase family protein [Flavobacterium algicola]MCG9791668.1 dienelactone hydrolase family protein [Flavobacterium algicola]
MKNKISILVLALLTVPYISFAQLKSVAYKDDSQKLSGFFAEAKRKNLDNAGVLILPAWMGIDDHSKESAVALKELGYHAFVADIYGVGNKPTNAQEAGKLSGSYKKDIANYHRRIQLALDQLVKNGANPDKIVVIGYCFGGTGAIEAARVNMKVKGVVSFHGGLARDAARNIDPITPKVLVLHGADDPYAPEKDIKDFQNEMRTAKADWQMNYYSNAVHGFTHKDAGSDNSSGMAYNKEAAERSWEAMLSFFKEVLK